METDNLNQGVGLEASEQLQWHDLIIVLVLVLFSTYENKQNNAL